MYINLEKKHICACISGRDIHICDSEKWAELDATRYEDMQQGEGGRKGWYTFLYASNKHGE